MFFGRGGEEAEALAVAGIDFELFPELRLHCRAALRWTFRSLIATRIRRSLFLPAMRIRRRAKVQLNSKALAKCWGTQVLLRAWIGWRRLRPKCSPGSTAESAGSARPSWHLGQQKRLLAPSKISQSERRAAGVQAQAIAFSVMVVSLRKDLNWFEIVRFSQANRGHAHPQTCERVKRAIAGSRSGCHPVADIRIEPPSDLREFSRVVQDAHSYEWIVFTSPNGAMLFRDFFETLRRRRERSARQK